MPQRGRGPPARGALYSGRGLRDVCGGGRGRASRPRPLATGGLRGGADAALASAESTASPATAPGNRGGLCHGGVSHPLPLPLISSYTLVESDLGRSLPAIFAPSDYERPKTG